MFKDVEDIKALFVPTVLSITLFYSMYAGLDYSRDIVVAFIALMTNKVVMSK